MGRHFAVDASVDIVGSEIVGCTGVGDGGTSVGIHVDAPGTTVRVLQDRIFGGVRSGTSPYVAAIQVVSAGSLVVHNSMLHAGEATGTYAAANGISIGPVANPSIVDDTIYAGANAGTPVVLLAGVTGARLTGLMVLGGGTGQTHSGVFAQACVGALSSVDHDLFANEGSSLYSCNPGDGGTSVATSLRSKGLYALLPEVAFSDLPSTPSPSTAPTKTPAASRAPRAPGLRRRAWGQLLGASWSASDDGVDGLFTSKSADGGMNLGGWTLPVGAPCAIARGGIPVAGITTDLYGAARSGSAPTIGAAELTGSCTP